MSKYNLQDIYNISNKLDEAIRAFIHLRRSDDYYGIDTDMKRVFERTKAMGQHIVDEVEALFDYADNYDYNLRVQIDFLIPSYNYLLDLAECKVMPSKYDADKWDNKPILR